MSAKRDSKGARELDYSTYRPGGQGSGFEPPQNVDDLTEVLEMGINQLKKQHGTPAKYPCSPGGLEVFKQNCIRYFEYLNDQNSSKQEGENRLIPDVEGLCLFIGISRQTLNTYEHTRPQEWQETIQFMKTAIVAGRKQLASNFKLPPVLEMMNLTNNFGYLNTNQFILKQETPEQKESAVLEAEVDAAGLEYDQETGEFIPKLPYGKGV